MKLKDNVRSILNIIEYLQHNEKQVVLIFLDGEKAFDKLNWLFYLRYQKSWISIRTI